MLANQTGYLSGHGADVDAGYAHSENRRDQFFIGKRTRTSFAQFLARAAVFGKFFDGPGHGSTRYSLIWSAGRSLNADWRARSSNPQFRRSRNER